MTAHTPPTPPAARERKLERVCFEASTTSFLTSSVEGIDGVDEGEEEEDIAAQGSRKRHVEREAWMLWNGIVEVGLSF